MCNAMRWHCGIAHCRRRRRRRDTIAQNAVRVFFFSILDVQGMRPPQLTVMMLLPSVKFQSSLYTPRTHEHSLGSLMCMMTMTLNEDVTPFSFLAS